MVSTLDTAAQGQSPRRRERIFSYVGQVLGGALLGAGFFKLVDLPPERMALAGTLITLVTWLCDEAVKLPSRDTRRGQLVHGALRLVSLAGFILALISLFELNSF